MNLDNLVISGTSFSEIMNSEILPKMFDVQSVFKYYQKNDNMKDEDLAMINDSDRLLNFDYLDLSGYTKITSLGVIELFNSKKLINIKTINFKKTRIDDAVIIALSNNQFTFSLEEIIFDESTGVTS
jgi:hypothetical protein